MAITVAGLAEASGFEGTLFRLLNEEGLSNDALKTLVDDQKARHLAVQFLNTLAGSSGTMPSYQSARDILGDDFIAPQEVVEAVGVSYTEAQLASLASTLPEKKVLQWARDNGFAVVAGPPSEMNLLDIHELSRDLFLYQKNDPWFADQGFARKDKVGTRWLVMRKGSVPNSTRKTWNEQQDQLSGIERIPNAAEAVWFFTTYAKVRGTRLVPSVYVRTSSVRSVGNRVGVGLFDGRGLLVGRCWVDGRHDDVGVASARRALFVVRRAKE